jgi:hypothetical protein
MSTELESFLKELAAELHISPEAAEQIWNDYHPEQQTTKDEPQERGKVSESVATGTTATETSPAAYRGESNARNIYFW